MDSSEKLDADVEIIDEEPMKVIDISDDEKPSSAAATTSLPQIVGPIRLRRRLAKRSKQDAVPYVPAVNSQQRPGVAASRLNFFSRFTQKQNVNQNQLIEVSDGEPDPEGHAETILTPVSTQLGLIHLARRPSTVQVHYSTVNTRLETNPRVPAATSALVAHGAVHQPINQQSSTAAALPITSVLHQTALNQPKTIAQQVAPKIAPTLTVRSNQEAINITCPVCLESVIGKCPVVTQCGHIFCDACIKLILQTQKQCPMCRKKLGKNSFCKTYPNTD